MALFRVNGMADSFQVSGVEQKHKAYFNHQTLRIFWAASKSCQYDDLLVVVLLPAPAFVKQLPQYAEMSKSGVVNDPSGTTQSGRLAATLGGAAAWIHLTNLDRRRSANSRPPVWQVGQY